MPTGVTRDEFQHLGKSRVTGSSRGGRGERSGHAALYSRQTRRNGATIWGGDQSRGSDRFERKVDD